MNQSYSNFLKKLQEDKVREQMKHVLLQLRGYVHDHTITDELGKDVDGLVTAGALSPQSGAFLRDSGVRFYGFSSATALTRDTPVLEIDMPTRRLVGTGEGTVVEYRKKQPRA